MIQPLILLAGISAAFMILNQTLGYRMSFDIGYGAFTLMAAMISATFLWLWVRRATPLAMGMAFGWAGAASVMGWWWMFNLWKKPPVIIDSPADVPSFVSLFRGRDPAFPGDLADLRGAEPVLHPSDCRLCRRFGAGPASDLTFKVPRLPVPAPCAQAKAG